MIYQQLLRIVYSSYKYQLIMATSTELNFLLIEHNIQTVILNYDTCWWFTELIFNRLEFIINIHNIIIIKLFV